MSKKKLKERKKKSREKIAKERVLKRRAIKRRQDKEESEMRKKAMASQEKTETIVKDETKKRWAKEQIEHNEKILKALEEEYERELKMREKNNEELQDCQTIEERMEKVKKIIADNQNKLNIIEGQGTANFSYESSGGFGAK